MNICTYLSFVVCNKPCMASSMAGPWRNNGNGYNTVASIFFMGIGSLFQSQQSRK
jgi:hypothetical protein